MKYKVGDEVRIKSIDWYNKNKDKLGVISVGEDSIYFSRCMQIYCGKEAKIIEINNDDCYYGLNIGFTTIKWADWMFEDKFININKMETKVVLKNE